MVLPIRIWHETLRALERTIPKYDTGNKILSLFQDWRLRKIALSILLSTKRREKILDLGGGPGTLENILSRHFRQVICIDFSKIMISYAKKKHGEKANIDYIRSTFEYLPLKRKSIGNAIASYSLRDSFNLIRALKEIAETIREKLVIVDIGKPESRVLTQAIQFYFKHIVPITTSLATGWIRGNPWKLLYKTFEYLPINSTLKSLVEKMFGKAEIHGFIFGAAIIVVGIAEHKF